MMMMMMMMMNTQISQKNLTQANLLNYEGRKLLFTQLN